jgi:hypothetical protein
MEPIISTVGVVVSIYGDDKEYAESLGRNIAVAIEQFGEETATTIDHSYNFEDESNEILDEGCN